MGAPRLPDAWRIPEPLWRRFEPPPPKHVPSPKGGRPPLPPRRGLDGIFYGGYTAHIKARCVEAQGKREIPGYRARRWVVERTHSWMNRFRRLPIRWEKKARNDVGLLHFACTWITFRTAGVLG